MSSVFSPFVFEPSSASHVELTKPECIGEFCLDKARLPVLGRSKLRYIYTQYLNGEAVDLDFHSNMESFIDKHGNGVDEGIDQLLRWILLMESISGSSLKKVIHEADFVMWRGTLSKIGASPYEYKSRNEFGVKITCVKYKGVFFIKECDTEAKITYEASRTEYDKKMCYGGLKFEQFVTTDKLGTAPDTSVPVDNNNEFIGMFRATLGGKSSARVRLLYGAETDAILPTSGEFVEIKTQQDSVGYGNFFHMKALKWWLQSYLVGIKQIVVGLHDRQHVKRVECVPVNELAKKYANNKWSFHAVLDYILAFLDRIKQILNALPEGTIIVAERAKGSPEFKFKPQQKDERYGGILTPEFLSHGWT